jgi:muconolactone D-isomerase
VEFLVHIEIEVPSSMPPEELRELQLREAARARELAAAGLLVRLWRVPGRYANVGLWHAPDASALHEALASLPMYRLMDIHVGSLATHPSDPGGTTACPRLGD